MPDQPDDPAADDTADLEGEAEENTEYPEVTYVGPHGDGVDLPLFGGETVARGETVIIADPAVAASMLDQPENWAPANKVARDLLDAIAFITALGPEVAEPGACPTCGATGDDPCTTKAHKPTARHAARD